MKDIRIFITIKLIHLLWFAVHLLGFELNKIYVGSPDYGVCDLQWREALHPIHVHDLLLVAYLLNPFFSSGSPHTS